MTQFKSKVTDRFGNLLRAETKNGETYSREKELEAIVAAAAKGAVESASGVSGDKQKAADAAKQALKDSEVI